MFRDLALTVCGFVGVISLASCSSGDGGRRDGSDVSAQSPSQALEKLSTEHRQAFEAWKGKLVKSCAASEVIGVEGEPSSAHSAPGLDGALLMSMNQKSQIVRGKHGEFAFLGDTHSFSAINPSKFEETTSLNGSSYTVKVEAKLNGSKCEIYLYGQKIHETTIYEAVQISAAWIPGHQAEAYESKTGLKEFADVGLTQAVDHGISQALVNAITPDKRVFPLLATHFGISEKEASKFFRTYLGRRSDALRLETRSGSFWFSSSSPRILVASDEFNAFLKGEAANVEWRLTPSRLSYGTFVNDADLGSIKISAQVSIAKKQGAPGILSYQVSGLRLDGLKPFDSDEAQACIHDRITTILSVTAPPSTLVLNVQPSTSEALDPCFGLAKDIQNLAEGSGVLKMMIPGMLANVQATPQTAYNGWDLLVTKLALEDLQKGQDISRDLTPSGSLDLIRNLASYLEILKSEITPFAGAIPQSNSLYEMGARWAFQGRKVDRDRMSMIISSIQNTMIPFQASTRELILNLSVSPTSNNDTLSFATGVDATYKALALRAFALAQAIDNSDWISSTFNQILQKAVTERTLQTSVTTFEGIQKQSSKYPGLKGVQLQLTRATIKWMSNGQATTEDLQKIYSALNNAIDPFSESVQQVTSALGDSPATQMAAIDFASTLTDEYKKTAVAIRDSSIKIGLGDWGKSLFSSILQNRPSLQKLKASLGAVVASMDFTNRELARLQGSSESFTESYRNSLIERAVKESWSADDFTVVEQIAGLAKFKIGCDRYQSVSSLAKCVDLGLFSKEAKKVLDPSFNRRYGALAAEFSGYLQKLQPESSYFSLRTSLLRAYFGSFNVIWSSCGDTAYQLKASLLSGRIGSLLAEQDQFKKWDSEREISKILEDCR